MKLHLVFAIAALGGLAGAQSAYRTTQTGDDAFEINVPVEDLGTLDLATGVITPPAPTGAQLATPGVIYDNTCWPYAVAPCNTIFIRPIALGQTRLDTARIPSRTSPAPNVGTMDTYRVTSFVIGYCTTEDDVTIGGPGARINLVFWENYDGCINFAVAGAPTQTVVLNLPGTLTSGLQRCVLINVNLVGGFEFDLKADADGVYTTGTNADEGFSYGYNIPTLTAGKTMAVIHAGQLTPNVNACAAGDATYYKNSATTSGTGLDNDDTYWRQDNPTTGFCFAGGTVVQTVCTTYPGPVLGSFYLEMTADLTDCNLNGLPDADDLSGGGSLDTNANGIPDECEFVAFTNYCTAGTTTNGCLATMSATGSTSVSTASGLFLNVSNVEGQKQGIMFYGVTGQVGVPWVNGLGAGNSFLCVKAPTQRTGSQVSGGTINLCDGSMTLDFFAYLTANPGANGNPFSAGQSIDVQGWFRDPPSPKTTNLSDGLHVTFAP